ncbi:copper amine oxidase N-terminal domain-containing protein [Paenibacillus sp. Leaf72]|uniref:copper amine oxidase N-terminal domain-containing protein n=1 Tax=Paenibacillus sp. Leaf72 TaxID=1736234 RepID=UPI000701B275|nr:copper amine oxidase N-terminal domain-containing protein [Paenibacillus sp. Leaf72]KQO10708.1 hypothetical protein ASF12_09935 [Paenibacillus sp. Leaf72]
MRKMVSALAAFATLFFVLLQPVAQAATTDIKIYIDGQVLQTDQPAIIISGSTFVPLRGIFEALDAKVLWSQKTKTVTATKGDTTVVLKLGARTATINNTTVTLDAPARSIKGRTVVPVRFVSESLGEDVKWDAKTRSVRITTSASVSIGAATSVSVSTVSQNGDGRDLQVNFTPPTDMTNVNSYRILVVPADKASSFNLAKAQIVGGTNYTALPTSSAYQNNVLTAQTRDTDGALLRSNLPYKVFILTVGNNDRYALSSPSASITLSVKSTVDAASNVRISDVSDFGDGRDLSVSFTRASNESNISSYRVIIVKTANASKFDLAAANTLNSSYYTTVSKTGSSTMSTGFSSSARDTSGEYIKNGVAYTAYVLSMSSSAGTTANTLSSASSSVTLGSSSGFNPTITSVADVSNYGDGRDLRVNFNRASDESRISYYRIFVVREADYGNFNLTEANNVASGRYTDVSRTGSSSYSQILSSSARDVKGNSIMNGVAYRVFVMGVTNNSSSYSSTLSTASSSIALYSTGVSSVTNVGVSDVSDYNNGQDLRVSFTRASDESSLNHYRIFVVRTANASSFNLAAANNITNSSYYTTVSKTGGNINQVLPATARDVNGVLIQNGVSYQVFVLSVGNGSSTSNNALSGSSVPIILSASAVTAAANVAVSDVNELNNGQDLLVAFTKAADETNLNQYRIFVVKTANAGSFNLAAANAVSNANNYTTVAKTGGNISQVLAATARDVNGDLIQNGISYQVFVLSVGGGSSAGTNALSLGSAAITLAAKGVSAAANVVAAEYNGGQDIKVDFTKASDESNIDHYRIFIVKSANAGGFDLNAANRITLPDYFTAVNKTDTPSKVLTRNTRDTGGEFIQAGVSYQVFVLSVGGGSSAGTNALSSASATITLPVPLPPAAAATAVNATLLASGQDIQVSFTKPADERNISQYRVFIVKEADAGSFNLASASASSIYTPSPAEAILTINKNTSDASGQPLAYDTNYRVYVLSVAKSGANALSDPSAAVLFPTPATPPATPTAPTTPTPDQPTGV